MKEENKVEIMYHSDQEKQIKDLIDIVIANAFLAGVMWEKNKGVPMEKAIQKEQEEFWKSLKE